MPEAAVHRRIKKLLALAADGRGNAHEADTALRQAVRLMETHGITPAQAALPPVRMAPERCCDETAVAFERDGASLIVTTAVGERLRVVKPKLFRGGWVCPPDVATAPAGA